MELSPPNSPQHERVRLSKALSRVLRHQAHSLGIAIRSDGFVRVRDLQTLKLFRHATEDDIVRVVQQCEKQRFQTTVEHDELYVRACQGHTIKSVNDSELLTKILDTDVISKCYHGTYLKSIPSIKRTGLNKMERNHIHLTPGLPGDGQTISGMRTSAQIILCIDMKAAMRAGIEFYRSANNVILSSGLADTGVIPPEFICEYITRDNGKKIGNSSSFSERVVVEDHSAATSVPETQATGCNLFENHTSIPHYYCVIDFEATCDNQKRIQNQEIIEFPAVIINAKTLAVEFEFHEYVRPVFNPCLTQFCTELTGIQQHLVDSSDNFTEVLNNFTQFMFLNGFDLKRNWGYENVGGTMIQTNSTASIALLQPVNMKTVEFITHGDWDLKVMLPTQAALSRVKVPPAMRKWINVKDLFRQIFPKVRSLGMANVLRVLNLELVGRHHSGIDDSRNIGNILISLLRRGVFTEGMQKRV